MKKLFFPLLAVGMVVFADFSYAAFGGSRGSSGVSRSYSRPSTPTYSKPASTYKAPSYSNSNKSSSYSNSNSYNSGYKSNYSTNSGYSNSNYRRDSYNYNDAPRQSSTMRDIGVTAAGVGGGILAAQAITALVSSPNHPGMYTHPQYPGQYFNQAGVPMPAPVQQAPQVVAPSQYEAPPSQAYLQPRSQVPQQPVVVVQQAPQESGPGFFGFLWGALWWLIKLAFFLGVVGALAYGCYRLFRLGKVKVAEEKFKMQFDTLTEGNNLNQNAMDIFYKFQANSDNEVWVKNNTKYLPVKECLSPPSEVIRYEHKFIDCTVEQGKLRATVLYNAVVNDGSGDVAVHAYWNFEKEAGIWKLIGFEQAD